jgi:hypothetical protein
MGDDLRRLLAACEISGPVQAQWTPYGRELVRDAVARREEMERARVLGYAVPCPSCRTVLDARTGTMYENSDDVTTWVGVPCRMCMGSYTVQVRREA